MQTIFKFVQQSLKQNIELSENNCEKLYNQIESEFELMQKAKESYLSILENANTSFPFLINNLNKNISLADNLFIKYKKFEKYNVNSFFYIKLTKIIKTSLIFSGYLPNNRKLSISYLSYLTFDSKGTFRN